MKRKGSTAAKDTTGTIDRLKEQFLADIEVISKFASVPEDLMINWDQPVVKFVPMSNCTEEVKGIKRLPTVGIDGKGKSQLH